MPDSSKSDLDWAKEYGAGGDPTPGYKAQQHDGKAETASSRDNQIVDAAIKRAESGKPTPDTMLRRQ
jgi:hypothetical protein